MPKRSREDLQQSRARLREFARISCSTVKSGGYCSNIMPASLRSILPLEKYIIRLKQTSRLNVLSLYYCMRIYVGNMTRIHANYFPDKYESRLVAAYKIALPDIKRVPIADRQFGFEADELANDKEIESYFESLDIHPDTHKFIVTFERKYTYTRVVIAYDQESAMLIAAKEQQQGEVNLEDTILSATERK